MSSQRISRGARRELYKAYTRESTEWVIRGVRGLRKKTDGPGEIMSMFLDEERDFGPPLLEDGLATVNGSRQCEGRVALEVTPGTRFLLQGKAERDTVGSQSLRSR